MAEYTSDLKKKADVRMTKATRRFKKNVGYSRGDWGDLEAEYEKAPKGATYEMEMPMKDLLQNLIEEAKLFELEQATVPITHCAVCGKLGHPASAHTAKALSAENNIGEGENLDTQKTDYKPKRKMLKHNPINQKGTWLQQLMRKMQMEDEAIQSRNTLEKCDTCGELHAHDVPCPDNTPKKKLLDEE